MEKDLTVEPGSGCEENAKILVAAESAPSEENASLEDELLGPESSERDDELVIDEEALLNDDTVGSGSKNNEETEEVTKAEDTSCEKLQGTKAPEPLTVGKDAGGSQKKEESPAKTPQETKTPAVISGEDEIIVLKSTDVPQNTSNIQDNTTKDLKEVVVEVDKTESEKNQPQMREVNKKASLKPVVSKNETSETVVEVATPKAMTDKEGSTKVATMEKAPPSPIIVEDNCEEPMEIDLNVNAKEPEEVVALEETPRPEAKDSEKVKEAMVVETPAAVVGTSNKRTGDQKDENKSKKLCGNGKTGGRLESHQPDLKAAAEVSQQVECVNLHCASGIGLTEAPVFVLTYYGIKYRKNILQKVCDVCYTAAENHYVTLCGMLKSGEPLLRAEFPATKDDVVVMDKVEEIREEDPLSAEVTTMVEDNLNGILKDVLNKCNVDFQLTESSYILKTKMDEITATIKKRAKEFDDIEKQLIEIRRKIYTPYRPTFKFLQPVDLTDPGVNFETLLPLSQCPRRFIRPTLPKCVLPPTVVISNEPTDVIALAEYTNKREVLRTGPVKHHQLTPGTPVYIIRSSTFGVWLKGKVIEVNQSSASLPYRVKFDSYRQGYIKSVSGKHLAYTEPSKLAYPVATRVIALFRNKQCPREDAYYVGIIAEPQKILNKFRYLVFFDDGYAQYVTHEHILPVCKVSANVCDDIHMDCREFIKNYLTQYPERPMVRLQPGQIVRTEWEGKWWPAKVMELDASLVRMDFENSSRSEWIYRGSTRLKPLYDQLVMRTRSIGTSFLKKRNMPYVEYSVEQDYSQSGRDNVKPPPPVRNVAKKSTSGRAPMVEKPEKPVVPLLPHERTEFPSKGIIRRMDLSSRIKSQVYEPHMCQRTCISWTNYTHMNTRYIPPLCIPLMVGFTRLLLRTRLKRVVVYTAPCGRKLRDMAELRTYLMTTKCGMGVDMFDFDHWVRVIDEFHLEPSMYKTHIADISDGAESMAVSCVNEIFDAWPQVMKYSTRRLPQKGVNLNTDVAFMVCCDCPDDCSNRDRCACWQLTISGTAQGPEGMVDPSVGYLYRRLAEPVSTGIYECHSGCKCTKSNCQNRVVQHPLSQRLQVFRTLRKGWGLRTLNDIPMGAFICVYVGRLHTEASANEGGRVYGDEYLAELDYIEVVEQFKEGYESEMVDPEEDDDDKDDEQYTLNSIWEERQTRKDKDFEVSLRGSRGDRSVSTRAQKVLDDDPNTITIDDDDEDVHRQMSKFTADVRAQGGAASLKRRSVREMMGDTKEDIYIMDAKYEGNIGRYLNHSCQPNVFVQNVFVDTQDVRFPWISFFAMSHIRAGTELTWDYNYNIGSVSEKVLYCYCGTPECRGRLL